MKHGPITGNDVQMLSMKCCNQEQKCNFGKATSLTPSLIDLKLDTLVQLNVLFKKATKKGGFDVKCLVPPTVF